MKRLICTTIWSWFELDDGTVIRYGSISYHEATDAEYLEESKEVLQQIVMRYQGY